MEACAMWKGARFGRNAFLLLLIGWAGCDGYHSKKEAPARGGGDAGPLAAAQGVRPSLGDVPMPAHCYAADMRGMGRFPTGSPPACLLVSGIVLVCGGCTGIT